MERHHRPKRCVGIGLKKLREIEHSNQTMVRVDDVHVVVEMLCIRGDQIARVGDGGRERQREHLGVHDAAGRQRLMSQKHSEAARLLGGQGRENAHDHLRLGAPQERCGQIDRHRPGDVGGGLSRQGGQDACRV